MLNIIEIQDEINKLEQCECTTQDVCKKLAILYIVKDHFKGESETRSNWNETTPPVMTAPSMASIIK